MPAGRSGRTVRIHVITFCALHQNGVVQDSPAGDDRAAMRSPDRPPPDRLDDAAVLPDASADEDAHGWGDADAGSDRADRDAWYERERPPHHE